MAKQISKTTIILSGTIRSKISKIGLPNLQIEAWDKDNLKDDSLGNAITNAKGYFTIRLEQKQGGWNLKDRKPDIYFKIYAGDKLIHQTNVAILLNINNDITTIEIFIDMENNKPIIETVPVFTVKGKVNNAKEMPIKQQALVAFDVDVKGASIYRTASSISAIKANAGFELLHEVVTDSKGNYSFSFYAEQFAKAERKKADIIVYAIDKVGEIIGRSKLVNSEDYTDQREINNLDIILEKEEEKTEYEVLMYSLLTFLKESDVPLLDLAKSADQLQFVAMELDLPVNHIQLVVNAELMRAGLIPKVDTKQKKTADKKMVAARIVSPINNSGILHELLYALGRQNISLNWQAMYKKTDSELKAAIAISVSDKTVKLFAEKEINNFLKQLHNISTDAILNDTTHTKRPSLEKILSSSLPDKALQKTFVEAYRNFKNDHTGDEVIDYKNFWNEYLPKTNGFKQQPKLIEKILFTQQLIAVSGGHEPVIAALQKESKVNTVKDLVALPEAKWKDIITKTGVPDYIKADTEIERVTKYSNQVQALLYAAYPTQKIQLLLKQKELPLQDKKVAQGIDLFMAQNEEFDFKTSTIDAFDKQIVAAAPLQAEAIKIELKTIQRVFQVSPAPNAMKVLMENNLTSAYSIANMPKKSFMQMHSAALGGEKMAEAVYQRAEHISTLASERAMVIHEMAYAEAPELAYSAADYKKVMQVMQSKFPNYTNLFGSPDICECEHCRSVYSAAAYMVDLLRFLWKGVPNSDGKSPLDMFELRRPDILALPLTCENTNTIIPYIDLVNEVMEFYTVHNTLTVNAAHDTGKTSAAELRANPQYVEKEAYRTLSTEVYPFTLPYHQPLDVIRTYGEHLKLERYEAMLAISATSNIAIQAESLQISEEQFIALTGEKFDGSTVARPLNEYFGYASLSEVENMAGTVSNGIHEFLHRAGIHYTDLIALIKTKFINPHQDKLEFIENLFASSSNKSDVIYNKLKQIKAGSLSPSADAILMTSLGAKGISDVAFTQWVTNNFDDLDSVINLYQSNSLCDLDTTYLRTIKNVYAPLSKSGILDPQWSRIHRFIRLWRKLGWKMNEVDLMLTSLDETDITKTTIEKLSYVVLLNKEHKLPINKLAVLWGNIDMVGEKSLYAKLFLNKAIQQIDDAFLPNSFGVYFSSSSLLSTHKSAICAAFQISDSDLNTLLDHISFTTPSLSDLSIQYLSIIYRYVILSNALQLKIKNCCQLITLFGVNPFSNINAGMVFINIFPSRTFEFYELIQKVKNAKFKTETLEYIFTGIDSYEISVGIKNEKLKSITEEVVKGFQEIDEKYPLNITSTITKAELSNLLSTIYPLIDDAVNANDIKILLGIAGYMQNFEVQTDKSFTPTTTLPASIAYDTISGKLSCKGIMKEYDRTTLNSLTGATDKFKKSIESLFMQSRTNDTDCPSFSETKKIVSAITINIPDDIASKFSYDNTIGKLTCLGVMSNAERVKLMGLNPNADYKLSVKNLYNAPFLFVQNKFSAILSNAKSISASNLSKSLLNHPSQPIEKKPYEKLVFIYKYFIPLLREKLQKKLILQKIALLTGLKENTTSLLIEDKLSAIINSTTPIDSSFSSLVKTTHRAALFILGLKLTDKELKHFIENKSNFENIDFSNLTNLHWIKINQFVQLRNALIQTQLSLIDLFEQANTTTAKVASLTQTLQNLSNWNSVQLNELVSTFSISVVDFKNLDKLEKLDLVISILSKTGLSVQTLLRLADVDTSFDVLHTTAVELRNVVKAKYYETAWLKLAGELNNKIRENQKQALISHLLTKPSLIDWGVTDADGLFEYFLIDVQMGACMDTSRIVQANAAIQMFVQRCFLNLESNKIGTIEKGVSPNAIDRDRWEWMKQYQMWAANRKVFLYPENWLEPEWRDDRSPFFKELESELTQNDISNRNVETAFRNYLTKMDTVSNLDVCGMYQVNDDAGKMKKLHVFGRTHNAPYQFFYRACSEFYKWGAWEKVPVDIRMVEDGENSGVHLVPVVWKNRLFIFWPEFIEKQEDKGNNNGTAIKDLANQTSASLKSTKYWEMRLAWSENIDGKWQPKQLSKEFIKVEHNTWYKNPNEQLGKIIIKSVIINNELLLIPYTLGTLRADWIKTWLSYPHFKLIDIQSIIEIINIGIHYSIEGRSSSVGENNFEKHNANSALEFWDMGYLQNNINHNLLFSNNILEKELAPFNPFFYSDKVRTYFVRNTNVNENLFTGTMYEINSNFDENDMNLYLDFYRNKGFEFHTFYHPYSSQFITNLNRKGIKELMDSDTLRDKNTKKLIYNDSGTAFVSNYNPTINYGMVTQAPLSENYNSKNQYTFYKENICFDVFGANSLYNWELFFHAPLYIATRLSKNGKYEEAMNWFHYIFDPTTDEMPVAGESDTARYWKTLPFRTNQSESLEEWFIKLSSNTLNEDEIKIIAEWRDNPFKPFVVARNRPIAFMKNVVIKYVENIRLWADSLFRAFTRESVNEALQLYVIANHILGSRPEFVPKRGEVKAETYNSLKDKLDGFSNALVEMENAFPFSSAVPTNNTSSSPSLLGMGQSLYFCIPSNEKLIEHWDIIADRLFKIRHCMDIDGNERHLALFAPPIDPAVLINAAANGLSLGNILSNLSSPPPIYRFTYLLQKANEFCGEVKSLGSSLLSAIEKQDGEELGRIRATHELNMLDLMTGIKERQILDAKVSKEGLLKSRETAALRLEYYNSLLSLEGIDVPAPPTIDADLNADSQLPADTSIAKIETDVDVKLVDSGEKGVKVIPREKEDMELSNNAINLTSDAGFTDFLAAYLKIIPQIEGDVKPVGVGAGSGFGGEQLAGMLSLMANSMRTNSSISSMQASAAQKMAGYIRREQEWTLQANLAAREIIQVDKQIISADIKTQISQKELANHKKQIENSKQVEQYLKDKFTNEELYQWMKEQLFTVYKESYNMAYDMGNKAEKCYRYELGIENTNYISYGNWDNAMKGLCSGEKLQLSLRQLEKSYIEENKREYELTKHISLNMLDPLALIKLRATGVCDFDIPEVLYDMDHPSHYFRRIKSVSISLPCIAGPYTSVSAKLSLVNNKYRKNIEGLDDYPEILGNDLRFVYNIGAIQSIAVSSSQNDSGVFELNFRDERYLPFEGTGAISSWRLELPTEVRQYDYNTIADVVMHIKYTAREGGSSLKTIANNSLIDRLAIIKQQLSEEGLHVAINMKNDMPNEWHMLKNKGTVDLKIDKSRLPYMAQGLNAKVREILFISISLIEIKTLTLVTNLGLSNEASDLIKLLQISSLDKMWKGKNTNPITINNDFKMLISNLEKMN